MLDVFFVKFYLTKLFGDKGKNMVLFGCKVGGQQTISISNQKIMFNDKLKERNTQEPEFFFTSL